MNATIASLLILYSLIAFGHALQCYNCEGRRNSGTTSDNNCFDNVNNKTIEIVDCRGHPGHHRGMTYQCATTLRHDRRNNTFVKRQCIVKGNFNYCEKFEGGSNYDGFTVDSCVTCEDDLCNSGVKIQAVLTLLPLFGLIWKM